MFPKITEILFSLRNKINFPLFWAKQEILSKLVSRGKLFRFSRPKDNRKQIHDDHRTKAWGDFYERHQDRTFSKIKKDSFDDFEWAAQVSF